MERAQKGPLVTLYAETRQQLTGKETVLEKKHSILRPLGWRTRGQATLKAGRTNTKDKDFNIVLAKGGIYTLREYEKVQDKNKLIVDTFFNRKPTDQIFMEVKTGIRDMVEFDSDLVEKKVTKRLNMEYDWKRLPYAIGMSKKYKHVLFSTVPWQTVEQFQKVREIWQQFQKKQMTCVKTIKDYRMFATYAETLASVSPEDQKYMKIEDPDINKLRMSLCSAWQKSKGGLKKSVRIDAKTFAAILAENGIPCTRGNVEDGRRIKFKSNSCPPTDRCVRALGKLKRVFPFLQPDQFLSGVELPISLTARPASECPFVSRAV
jgi:hypothetical protein